MSEKITHIYRNKLILAFLLLFLGSELFSESSETINKQNQEFFTQNLGQISDNRGASRDDVLFYANMGSLKVYFRTNGISYVFSNLLDEPSYSLRLDSYVNTEQHDPGLDAVYNRMKKMSLVQWRFDMDFVNCKSNSEVIKEGESSSFENFYTSSKPWGVLNVRSYKSIIYKNIYKNIDLKFYFSSGNLKYDFIVYPGGDPGIIEFHYNGINSLFSGDDGSVSSVCPLGSVVDSKPVALSESGNKTECKFLVANQSVKFNIGEYDKTKQLIIDPQVFWSTYFGGTLGDHVTQIKLDRFNNFVITGSTLSDDFPASAGAFQTTRRAFYDAIIAKFSTTGDKIWATYYGGTDTDYGAGITTDFDTKVYVSGWTWSNNFPLTPDCYQSTYAGGENDGFVLKFDNLGRREWATYLGGSRNDHIYGIVVDEPGKIYVTGWTGSNDFPHSSSAFQNATAGYDDAFVTALTGDGNFIWGTYFGGDSIDGAQGILIDRFGDLVIGGYSRSHNLPATINAYQKYNNGLYDGFVAKFDTTGNMLYNSYYGGIANDFFTCLATNTKVDMILAGYTYSKDLIVGPSALQNKLSGYIDGMIVDFTKDGARRWSTYLGGNDEDNIYAMSADNNDNYVFIGRTFSADFPVTPSATQKKLKGSNDAFAIRIGSAGNNPVWSTYLGGSNNEWGYACDTDEFLNVYLGGDTESDDFPVTSNAHQVKYGKFIDIFLQKVCAAIPSPIIKINGPTSFCEGDSVELDAGPGFNEYLWQNGEISRMIFAKKSGDYFVTVLDANGCAGSSQFVTINVNPMPAVVITGQREFCENDSSILDAGSGYVNYLWSNGLKTRYITAKKAGKYSVFVIDNKGCTGGDSVNIEIYPNPKPMIRGPKHACKFSVVIPYFLIGTPGHNYTWNVNGGSWVLGSDESNILVSWGDIGQGVVYVKDVNQQTGCVGYDSMVVTINEVLKPDISPVNKNGFTICEGDSLLLDAGEGYMSYKWSNNDTNRILKVRKSGTYWVLVKDGSGCGGLDTVQVSVVPFPTPEISGDTVICGLGQTIVYESKTKDDHRTSWLSTGGIIESGGNSQICKVKFDNEGKYIISLTEEDTLTGCSFTAVKEVNVSKGIKAKITTNGKTEFCEGDSVILDAGADADFYFWSTHAITRTIIARTSGFYKVTLSDKYGCSSEDSVEVIVHPLPQKPVLILSKDTLYSTKGDYYRWYENEQLIQNARDFIKTKDSTFYKVVVGNKFGCEAISDSFFVVFTILKPSIKLGLPDTVFLSTGDDLLLPVTILKSQAISDLLPAELNFKIKYNKSIVFINEKSSLTNLLTDKQSASFNLLLQDTIGTIKKIRIKGLLGNTVCDSIIFESASIKNIAADFEFSDGVLCIDNVCKEPVLRLYDGNGKNQLLQNVPNPAGSETEIGFSVLEEGNFKLYILDVLGKEIETVVDKYLIPGTYKISFNTSKMQNGVYYYILQTPSQSYVKKMEIVR